MDWYMQLVVLLALVGTICSAFETREAKFSTGATSLKLNKEEDVELECVIRTDEGVSLTHDLKWYKEQDTNSKIEVGDKEEEIAPFDNSNKYELHIKSHATDPTTQVTEALYTLTIRGVDRNDAGKYMCASGKTEDSIESSDAVELIITPDDAAPVLTSSALKENDVYKFNMTNEVSCDAVAPSSSVDLNLAISIDGMSAGPEFQVFKVVTWEGSTEGLKIPTTKLNIKNPSWQPSNYGQFRILCEFMDGERSLGNAEITAARDEPPIQASIGCYSNYGTKRAKTDDTDLAIICTTSNTDGLEDIHVEFEFFNLDKSVTLKNGDDHYGRMAKNDPKDPQIFILEIPRVIKEIVTKGQNIYNVTLYGTKDGTVQALDFIEFILPVDPTARSTNGGWTAMPMAASLLLSIIILLL